MNDPSQESLISAAKTIGLELKFKAEGPAYERAKSVADALGIDMQSYLLMCIREGHNVLKARIAQETDYEIPAIVRRPPPDEPRLRKLWEATRALFG